MLVGLDDGVASLVLVEWDFDVVVGWVVFEDVLVGFLIMSGRVSSRYPLMPF